MKVKHTLPYQYALRLFAVLCCIFALAAQAQERTFTRTKVLLEKHTGISCSWCPYGDRAVEGFLVRHPEYADKMFEMRHNSYSSGDVLTVDFHNEIKRMWDVDGHPRYYVDRCHPDGYRYETPREYGISWGSFNTESFDPVGRRLSIPTNVSISLSGSAYNTTTKTLTVRVSGEVTKTLPDLHISVFLTQDIYYPPKGETYEGTSRAFLTRNVHGDLLPVSNGRYDVAYTYTIPDRIGSFATDLAKMKVVAFVSSFDESDFSDSEIHNCDVVSVTSLPNAAPRPRPICASPNISLQGHQLAFASTTPGAVYYYTISSRVSADCTTARDADLSKATFTVTAYAAAPGYKDSPEISRTFTLLDLIGDRKDINGDGTISVSDIPTLIRLLQTQK